MIAALALLTVAFQGPAGAPPTPAMDSAVTSGIKAGAFPGAAVIVGTADRILLSKGYGHLTWSAHGVVPQPDSTLYDLASLTKVVATTPSIMVLVDRGRVDLDRPVQAYLPAFQGAGKDKVTVRDLLTHRSGLRASLRLDTLASNPAQARDLVMHEPLRWPPHTRTVYSDLNAMLLGWIVEAVSGVPLDRFAHDSVFEPLGMTQTMYQPSRGLKPRIAPVSLWHGVSIAGAVHDQNAARLGGVSGHAGLYATAADLARYAQWYLHAGRTERGTQLVRPSTVSLFTRRVAGDRALGWEMRDPKSTDNTGRVMSASTFGHTGFTGTSLWIDPDRGVFVIVLTNRVYAPRTRRSISTLKHVRGLAADAAVGLFQFACGSNTERRAC